MNRLWQKKSYLKSYKHLAMGLASIRFHKKAVVSGIVSAMVLALAFPPQTLWPLIFIGMVPFFWCLFEAQTFVEVFWLGVSQMIAYSICGFHWISEVATNFGGLPWIVGKFVLLAFSLFGQLHFLLFALLGFAVLRWLRRAHRNSHEIERIAVVFILLPLLYVGIDFAYPKIFPDTLGHSLYGWFALAQVAELTGVYGLTFLIVCINVVIAAFVAPKIATLKLLRRQRSAIAGPLPTVVSGAFFFALLIGVLVLGHRFGKDRILELQKAQLNYGRSLRFAGIQGNIGDLDKLASEKGYEPAVQKVLDIHRTMSLAAVKNSKIDLVVWPETSYPFLYTHFQDEKANRNGSARDVWIEELMRELKTPLLFGAYSSVGRRDFNSAFLVSSDFKLVGRYQKSILLAFGEYVPLGPLAGVVQSIVPTIADFGRGQGPMLFEVPTPTGEVRLAPQICYEGIFPEHSRRGVLLGADVLLNITNDSWFGLNSEAELHLLLTVFRSIELRRPMIRVTNTGISTWIDATGRMMESTQLFEVATLLGELRLPNVSSQISTFYARHGELFASFAAIVAVIVAFITIAHEFCLRRR